MLQCIAVMLQARHCWLQPRRESVLLIVLRSVILKNPCRQEGVSLCASPKILINMWLELVASPIFSQSDSTFSTRFPRRKCTKPGDEVHFGYALSENLDTHHAGSKLRFGTKKKIDEAVDHGSSKGRSPWRAAWWACWRTNAGRQS